MGSLLSRSSRHRDGRKIKVKKDKHKHRYEEFDVSYTPDMYVVQDEYDDNQQNIDFTNTYDIWEKNFDQHKMRHTSDAPGAPITYPVPHNDIMVQSWSPSRDTTNSFYLVNSQQVPSSFNRSYDTNQYPHSQVSNIKQEERPSKKVKFSPSLQQQQQPLSNTQSLQETREIPLPLTTPKPSPLSKKTPVTQPTVASSNTPPVEKPIYVTIDHRATLAERGQTIAAKHRRKNDETNSPNTHSRSRSQPTHHRHKHQKPPLESPDSRHLLNKSTSTNVLAQNNEENHRRSRRQQLQMTNNSPSHRDFSPNKPMMRIPLTQNNRHRQRHSSATLPKNTTRI